MALKVGELFASFNLDTSGIDSAVSGAEKSLSNIGKGLTIGGAAMTAAVTVPLVNAAKDIYAAGSSFDAQMSKVFAIAGDSVTSSTEKMEALRSKALEMGSTTQFTASQAGEAFEYMAMAGWKTEQMLSAIEPLMNLAAAAGADLGTTSDIVTDAMTAFGMSAEETWKKVVDGKLIDTGINNVEHFADVLAAASSNSNTNVTMLGESFKFAAPLAGSLGYSLEDVAIALGLMANNGIKSSMAGTSLSRVIQNMAKPSDQTAIAMEKLGLSLYDSKGNVKSLRDLMSDFRGVAKKNNVDIAEMTKKVSDLDAQFSAGKLTEDQYEKELAKLTEGSSDFLGAITQIAGARGLPGLLAIMNATDKDFDSLVNSIDNATGSASRMKQVMLDNVEGAVTILKSAVEGLEITLWDLVKGPVKTMIERATGFVDAFRKMDSATQEGVLRMAAYAASIGPAMTGSGVLLMALPKIASGIAALASPLGLVSIGLLAVGAAAADSKNLMGKNLEKMAKSASASMKKIQKSMFLKNWTLAAHGKNFLNSVINSIKEAGPVFMDTLASVLRTGISAVGRLMPKAAETATTLVKTITDGIARNAPSMMKELATSMTSLVTSVIGAVPDMLNAGVTLFSALISAIGKVDWLQIGTKLNTAVTDALKEIRTNFYTLVFGQEPTAEDLGDWGKLGSKITENIKAGIQKASDNGKNLIGGLVLGSDYDIHDSWGTVAQKIWDKITAAMPAILQNAGDLLKGLVLGEDYTADASWAVVATKIWSVITTAFDALKATAKDVLGTITLGDDYTADTSWGQIGTAIWGTITSTFNELKATAKDVFGTIVLGDAYTADTSWGTIGSAIWEAIKSSFDTLKATAKDVFGSIVLGGDYEADTSWGTIGTAIWGKITSSFDELKATAKDTLGNITLGADYSADDSWGSIGQAIWDKIQEKLTTLGENAVSLIGNLVLGSDYSADDSWKTIGTKIWEKAQAGFAELSATAKNLIGSLVLGEDYDPGDSWKTIGSAIWDKAKTGFSEAFTAAKDIIGTFVLGEDYEADDSWKSIGSSVWQKAQDGFKNAYKTTKEIIGTLALGDDYEADESWASIGQAIWDKIKSKLTSLCENAKDLIGTIVYSGGEEGYSADDSWSDIGGKIWEKVQSGITAGKDMASAILEKIGSVEIDVAGVLTTIQNAGTFVTNLVGKMLEGKIEWGTKITGLAQNIADQLADYGWDGIGTTLGQVANNLIGAITAAIPNAIDAAGNAVDVGLTLAEGILSSISSAFTGEGLDIGLSGIVQALVDNLIKVLPKAFTVGKEVISAGFKIATSLLHSITEGFGSTNIQADFSDMAESWVSNFVEYLGGAMEFGGELLTAGAKIAQSMFASISAALAEVNESGIAEKLGEAAKGLLENLLQNIGGLKDNTEINTFLTNLGQSIIDSMGTLGEIAGDFASKLIAYLFSADGLRDLYNAGTAIIQLILDGMNAGISGVINFFGNMIDKILIETGLVDEGARNAAQESGKNLAASMLAGMQSEVKDSQKGKMTLALMDYFLLHGGQGWQYVGEHLVDDSLNIGLNGAFSQAAEKAGDSAEAFRDALFEQLKWDIDIWDLLGIDPDSEEEIDLSGLLPEDLNFWGELLKAFNEGNQNKLMDLMAAQGIALFGEMQDAVTQAEQEAEEKIRKTQEKLGIAAAENAEQTNADIINTIDTATNEFAQNGMATAIKEEAGAVEAEALSLADEAVQTFLMTMSAENGQAIGRQFIDGIIAILDDGTLVAAADVLGQSAFTSLSNALSGAAGVSIGRNFGLGLANGISSMTGAVTSAAWNLGISAANALSSAIQEGSPSKLTYKSGGNFGLGFINSIMDMSDRAAEAAASMGRSAARALEYTVQDIGAEASQIDYQLKNGYDRAAEAYHAERQNDPAIEQMTDRIIEALGHMMVCIDGEPAGQILTPYVSEIMAHGTSVRR